MKKSTMKFISILVVMLMFLSYSDIVFSTELGDKSIGESHTALYNVAPDVNEKEIGKYWELDFSDYFIQERVRDEHYTVSKDEKSTDEVIGLTPNEANRTTIKHDVYDQNNQKMDLVVESDMIRLEEEGIIVQAMGGMAPLTIIDETFEGAEEDSSGAQPQQINEEEEMTAPGAEAVAATPSITIVPGSLTSTSVSLNCVFPFSGQRGNAIGLYDFNNGLIIWNRNYGNNIFRGNGNVTISGLVPGGLYQIALMWSTDNGETYGDSNTIFRRVITLDSTTETWIRTDGTQVYANIEPRDMYLTSNENINTWLSRLSSAHSEYIELTGYRPNGNAKFQLRSTRDRSSFNHLLTDGQVTWSEYSGWYQDGTAYFYRPFMRSDMLTLYNDNWTEIGLHEMSHYFDNDIWKFDTEFFACFKMFYVAEKLHTKIYRCDMDRYYIDGAGLLDYYTRHHVYGYNNGFNTNSYNFAFGLSKIFYDLKNDISYPVDSWKPFKDTFRRITELSEKEVPVPTTKIGKFNLFLSILRDKSNADVISMMSLSPNDKQVIQSSSGLAGTIGYINNVTITWNPGGGASVSPTSSSMKAGANFNSSWPTPIKAGYTFDGWRTENSDKGTKILVSTIIPYVNKTYYAKWILKQPVKISWDPNGGTVNPTSSQLTPELPFNTLPTPQKAGNTFDGWWTGSGGSGTQITSESIVPATAKTYFAKWTAIVTAPTQPRSLIATPGNGWVALSWTAPSSNGGAAINGYEVSSNGGISYINISNSTAYTFTGLNNGTSYNFRVRAVNAAGTSEPASTTATPTAPPSLNVSLDPGEITIVAGKNNQAALTDCIALVKGSIVKVGTVANPPANLEYKWQFLGTTFNSGNFTGMTQDIFVNVPSNTGKYELLLTFRHSGIEQQFTYTVYATHGYPQEDAQGQYYRSGIRVAEEGVTKSWMDVMLNGKITPTATVQAIFEEINRLGGNDDVYDEGEWVYYSLNNHPYNKPEKPARLIRDNDHTINGGNCGTFVDVMSALAGCVGIQGLTHAIEFDSKDFLMPNLKALDGTHNADGKASPNSAAEESWIFPDHALYRYGGVVYDPTLHISFTGTFIDYENRYVYAKWIMPGKMQVESHQSPVGNRTFLYSSLNERTHKDITKPYFEYTEGGWTMHEYDYFQTVPGSMSISALSSSEIISAVISVGDSWTATTNDNWLSLGEPTTGGSLPMSLSAMISGDEEDMIEITAAPNPSNQIRTGTVTIVAGDETSVLTINQDGANEWMNVADEAITASASGMVESIGVSCNVYWRAVVDADWIQLTNDDGLGEGTVAFVIDRNDTIEERNAVITVSGVGVQKAITVTQPPYSASSDATLDTLIISQGAITPAFHPSIRNYTATVTYDISDINLTATPYSFGAVVSGAGQKSLSPGINNVTVSVVAEDGITTMVYSIVITREQNLTPVPASITFDLPSYSMTIPGTGNTTIAVAATIKDQFGAVMQGLTPSFIIEPVYNGVSIDSSSGIVTITSLASPGNVALYASYGGITAASTVTLSGPMPTGVYGLQFDEPYYELQLEEWPDEEGYNPSVIVCATAVGISGQGIPLSASITYSNGYTLNTTGEFFATELWYDNSLVTATATFSDGTIREIDIWVDVSIISYR